MLALILLASPGPPSFYPPSGVIMNMVGQQGVVKAVLVMVGSVLVTFPPLAPFTTTLPVGVPNFDGWEKSSGEVELDRPRRMVQYELYVNPRRNGLYEVVRYRITLADPRGGDEPIERLQWHAFRSSPRRFECRPPGSGPCQWREVVRGTREFERETGIVVWLYGLHRDLLYEREQGRLPQGK